MPPSRLQVKVQPVYDENDELAAFMSMLTEIDEGALEETGVKRSRNVPVQ